MDQGRVHCIVQGIAIQFQTAYFDAIKYLRQLETDQTLLIPKARGALKRYGHQVVIGNDLHRRKFEVVFVSPNDTLSALDSTEPSFVETWIKLDPSVTPPREIEEDIVAELVKRHAAWMQ